MPSQKLIVSAREAADWIGASERLVRDLADRGIAVREARGRYDIKATIANYVAHLRQVSAGRGGEESQLDLTKEKARESKERADSLAIKNAKMRGELLPVDDVLFGWSHIMTNTRLGVLAIVPRLSQEFGLSPEQEAVLDAEVRRALTGLADDPLRPLGADGDEGDERHPPSAETSTFEMD